MDTPHFFVFAITCTFLSLEKGMMFLRLNDPS